MPNTKQAGNENQRERKWPSITPMQHPAQVLEEGRVSQAQLVNSPYLQQLPKTVCAESLQLSPSGVGANLVFTSFFFFFPPLCFICVKVKETACCVCLEHHQNAWVTLRPFPVLLLLRVPKPTCLGCVSLLQKPKFWGNWRGWGQ